MNHRQAQNVVFKTLKDKIHKHILLYSAKLPATIEELKKNTFHDKQKLEEFIATKEALQ